MGRELKRVALDFNYPLGQLWSGYLNPYHSIRCKACEGTGLNPATLKLSNDWYSFDKVEYVALNENRRYNNLAWQYHLTQVEVDALVESGRLRELGNNPTPEEVNEWAKHAFGHDSCNQWICVKARAGHMGVYGECSFCDGEGEIWNSPEIKALHKTWMRTDPPAGEGFQLWNTTTEGHPMTPVFSTLEALCEYLEDNKVSVFAFEPATKERWLQMLGGGLVTHETPIGVFV